MSKQSRMEQKEKEIQEQREQEVMEDAPTQRIKPVSTKKSVSTAAGGTLFGRSKKSKSGDGKAKTANGNDSVKSSAKVGPKKATASAKKPQSQSQSQQSDSEFPEWAANLMQRLTIAQEQLANQIVEDHRVLTDHEWRIHDLEKHCFGADYVAAPKAEEVKAAEKQSSATEKKKPSVTEVVVEPPQDDQKVTQAAPQVTKEPDASAPKGAVPRQMYEAEVFEDDKWVLYGPFPKISRAEQATNGDLSKVHIVQVWYDHDRDIVIRQLTADELDRYCK